MHTSILRALGLAALSLSFVIAALPTTAQEAEVEIKTQLVAPGVYMLVGSGGNLGLSVGEDGAFLVDDQYAPLTEKIRAAVAKVTDKPLRFVLNTHWHGDHTGGNENLGKAGVLIVAHDNVRVRMSAEHVSKFWNGTLPPSPKAALPVVTFTNRVSFHLNGDRIDAFHVPPAHTDGDAVVHVTGANVVHMGDLYFNGLYPFIDVESGGNVDGVIAAADQVLAMIDDETKVIPGHGALSNKGELKAYRDMLATVRDRVAKLIAEGKTEAEVIAAKPSAEWDETWGKVFLKPEQFIQLVYASLGQKAS